MSCSFQWDCCLCKDGITELCFIMALCFVCYLQTPNFYSKLWWDTHFSEQLSSCRMGAFSFVWHHQCRNPSSAEISGKTALREFPSHCQVQAATLQTPPAPCHPTGPLPCKIPHRVCAHRDCALVAAPTWGWDCQSELPLGWFPSPVAARRTRLEGEGLKMRGHAPTSGSILQWLLLPLPTCLLTAARSLGQLRHPQPHQGESFLAKSDEHQPPTLHIPCPSAQGTTSHSTEALPCKQP